MEEIKKRLKELHELKRSTKNFEEKYICNIRINELEYIKRKIDKKL